MKNKTKNYTKKFKSVDIKNGTTSLRAAKNGHLNINDRRIRIEPKVDDDYLNVDGSFPHILALPSNFQMKGQKVKLFSRESIPVNKLYHSPSLDSSGTDQSTYSEQLYDESSFTRNERYQAARDSYYPDKFHVLKEQIQILHQVINNRGKRITSLKDVVSSLQEQRQQLENSST